MAKLSAHGTELLRVEFLTYRLAYMSDGQILRDNGAGWKQYKKFKAGVDVSAQITRACEFNEKPTTDRVMRCVFRQRMAEVFPSLSNRLIAFHTIELMPDDADGVWSTLEDAGLGEDLNTVVELCRLYRCAHTEGQEARDAKANQVPALA